MSDSKSPIFVGIDVSAKRLDVAVDRAAIESFTNEDAGIAALCRRLNALSCELIVLEATGGYEALVVASLAAVGLPVRVLNPRQVRDFARATGLSAKTDRLDAQVLREFAERLRPVVLPQKSEQERELSAIVSRRRELVQMLVAEKNRLKLAIGSVRKDITAHIRFLEKRIDDTDADLRRQIRAHESFRFTDELLQSVHYCLNSARCRIARSPPWLALRRSTTIAAVEPGAAISGGVAARYSGTVLDGRYHLRALHTPLEVHRALRYVLLNHRHHAAQRCRPNHPIDRAKAAPDPASSGRWFDGWRIATAPPNSKDTCEVAPARTWLLHAGWRRHGLIDPAEVP